MSLQNWMLVALAAAILLAAYLRYCGARVDIGRMLAVVAGIVLVALVLMHAGWIGDVAHTVANALPHSSAAQPGQMQDMHPARQP